MDLMMFAVFMLVSLEDCVIDALMGTDLEVRVDCIGDDEKDCSDAGDMKDSASDINVGDGTVCTDGSVESSRYDKSESTCTWLAIVDIWQGHGIRCEKKITSNFTDYLTKFQFIVTHASNEEAHSEAQKLGSQDRTKDGSFDNLKLVVLHQNHEHHNLDNRAKSRLQQNTKDLMQLSSHFCSSKTNKVGAWHHGNVVEDEDREVKVLSRIGDSNCGRYDGP